MKMQFYIGLCHFMMLMIIMCIVIHVNVCYGNIEMREYVEVSSDMEIMGKLRVVAGCNTIRRYILYSYISSF